MGSCNFQSCSTENSVQDNTKVSVEEEFNEYKAKGMQAIEEDRLTDGIDLILKAIKIQTIQSFAIYLMKHI